MICLFSFLHRSFAQSPGELHNASYIMLRRSGQQRRRCSSHRRGRNQLAQLPRSELAVGSPSASMCALVCRHPPAGQSKVLLLSIEVNLERREVEEKTFARTSTMQRSRNQASTNCCVGWWYRLKSRDGNSSDKHDNGDQSTPTRLVSCRCAFPRPAAGRPASIGGVGCALTCKF